MNKIKPLIINFDLYECQKKKNFSVFEGLYSSAGLDLPSSQMLASFSFTQLITLIKHCDEFLSKNEEWFTKTRIKNGPITLHMLKTVQYEATFYLIEMATAETQYRKLVLNHYSIYIEKYMNGYSGKQNLSSFFSDQNDFYPWLTDHYKNLYYNVVKRT